MAEGKIPPHASTNEHGKPPPPHEQNGHARDRETAPPPSGEPLDIFTASDLMRMEIPPPRWAVETILPEGLNLFAGKPKLGKSWLALHVALAVAAGGIVLGRIRVECGTVLYVALEDTKRRLQSRIRRLLGPDEQLSCRLHLSHDWPRMERGGLDSIAQWIEANRNSRLIVIDTWQRFRPVRPGKSDSYEIDYADGAQVKTVADKYGISILIVHHCRKLAAADALEEVSGSVGLTGSCDGVLVLRRERGQQDAALIVSGRDVDDAELALTFCRENCLWQLVGDGEAVRLGKERQEVIALLKQAKRPMTPTQAAPLLGKSLSSAKKILWRMANDGLIEVRDGKYSYLGEPGEPEEPRHPAGSSGSSRDDRERNREDEHKTPWG